MTTNDGFILIESLVSLAMVSLLAVSTLNLLQSVSTIYRTPPTDELQEATLRTTLNPDSRGTANRMTLETIHTLKDDSTWRIYTYRTEDGSRVTVPIFVPASDS